MEMLSPGEDGGRDKGRNQRRHAGCRKADTYGNFLEFLGRYKNNPI